MIGSSVRTRLRDLKRQHTRNALVDATVRLSAEQGFGATTVEQIAESCGVSSRTFFRYFATKEEALLEPLDDVDAYFHDVFVARPHGEPAAESFAAAVTACWGADWSTASVTRRLEVSRIVQNEAGLLAADLRRGTEREERLIQAVVDRLGVDFDEVRPGLTAHRVASLVVATMASAIRVAWREWLDRESSVARCGGTGDPRELFLACIDQIGPALALAGRRASTPIPARTTTSP